MASRLAAPRRPGQGADEHGQQAGNGGPPPSNAAFASGARVLSIGIASTGIFTFAYLAAASHELNQRDYGQVSLC